MSDRNETIHDMYKQLNFDVSKVECCPVCNSLPQLWQFSKSETDPRQLVVMCTYGERIGPQDGALYDGCPLYMPGEEFYRGTERDAIRYWNEFAKAITALREQNQKDL